MLASTSNSRTYRGDWYSRQKGAPFTFHMGHAKCPDALGKNLMRSCETLAGVVRRTSKRANPGNAKIRR